MTVSYPLTIPAALRWASVVDKWSDAVAVSAPAFGGPSRSYDWDASNFIYEMQVSTQEADAINGAAIRALFRSLRTGFGTFSFGDPVRTTPLGIGTGSPLVNGALQVGNILITDGWTNSQTNILRAGDMLQLESNLYMNLTDVNSGPTTGPATLDIWPSLRKSPADNAAITVTNPVGVFRILAPVAFDISPDVFMRGQPFLLTDVPQV